MILHIACQDLAAANELLEKARRIYKKSCILSASNKIIVEVRGSEFMEMPMYRDNNPLFSGDLNWLTFLINEKLQRIWQGMDRLKKMMGGIKHNRVNQNY